MPCPNCGKQLNGEPYWSIIPPSMCDCFYPKHSCLCYTISGPGTSHYWKEDEGMVQWTEEMITKFKEALAKYPTLTEKAKENIKEMEAKLKSDSELLNKDEQIRELKNKVQALEDKLKKITELLG